jgi:UTP--glucose-1-phosphate uridylyltransferase
VHFSSKIRKAVIPAAGLGTRFLPITKSMPKEMLPICDRPVIQFAVEEAASSGLEEVILVLSRDKNVLVDYFQRNVKLEHVLHARGRHQEAELLESLSNLARIQTAYQDAPLGLAHAIGCARSLVENEPFAVILPDAIIDSPIPCTRQLITCYSRHKGCVIASQLVAASEIDHFGILELMPMSDSCCQGRTMRIRSLVERPAIGSVSSRFGIFGRYILDPEIFNCIEEIGCGFSGEFQLTDALALCSQRVPLYAYQFEGTHYDAGQKLGFLRATLAYAMKDPELARCLTKLPHLITATATG